MNQTSNDSGKTMLMVAEMQRAEAKRRILAAIEAAKEEMRAQYRRELREKKTEFVIDGSASMESPPIFGTANVPDYAYMRAQAVRRAGGGAVC